MTRLIQRPVSEAAVETILLVDGYNVVGAWPRLIRLRDRQSLEAARSELVEQLAGYASFRGYRAVLVFDAQLVTSPLVRTSETPHLEVCFTDYEQTADSFIEKYSYQLLRENRRRRVRVATSDRAQQVLVLAQGASWLSSEQLLKEVEAARRQMREDLRNRKARPGNKLADRLDPTVRDKLARWRFGE